VRAAQTAHAAADSLHVIPHPSSTDFIYFNSSVTLQAGVTDGCKPYTFHWQLVKRDSPYVRVTPTTKTDRPGDPNPATSKLPIRLKCTVPFQKHESFRKAARACDGGVAFEVDVTDSSKRTGHAFAVFDWKPRCLTAEDRKRLEDQQKEIFKEILNGLRDAIGSKLTGPVEDHLLALLEADAAGPFLAAYESITDARAAANLANKYYEIEQQLTDPNC